MFPPLLTSLALASFIAVVASSVNGSGTITFGSSVEHLSVSVSGSSGRATFEDKAAGGSLINFHQPGTSTDCAGEFDLTPVKGNFTIQ
jgi:hypothetical protein